jgi:TatA/E family protein of Tat protein translocase
MFGIGMPELLLILVVALVIFGPKKLPDLARSMGRALNEFKRATRDLKDTIDIEDDVKDIRKPFDDAGADLKKTLDDSPPKALPPSDIIDRAPAPQVDEKQKTAVAPEKKTDA